MRRSAGHLRHGAESESARGAAGRLARGLTACVSGLLLAAGLGPAWSQAPGRLLLDAPEVPVDAPVWVCADGAPRPAVARLDGVERLPAAGGPSRSRGPAPRPVHLVLRWPERGPLVVWREVPGRKRAAEMPFWGQDGWLGPGEYVLAAAGFAPETLRVRDPRGAERAARAVLARARLHAEAGDSALAARLVERLLEQHPGGPYEDAAFLALGRLWRFSRFSARPRGWLAEWVARHHSRCAVGEGIRVWLEVVPEPEASQALRRTVSGYPETRAAAAAAEWLAGREPGPR